MLEHALEEASNLGHHYIGTEHLLLGLIRDDGLAGKVLADARLTGEGLELRKAE